MNIQQKLVAEFGLKDWQVENTLKLIEEGNTIPFIARYRKELTGALSDDVLRELHQRLTYLQGLEERKEQVIHLIDEQGKLTEELKTAILKAETLVEVEDLYLPYKQKRRTKATIAKEKGLEPLALSLLEGKGNAELMAESYLNEEMEVRTTAEALQGARDIIAEMVSEDSAARKYIRNYFARFGKIVSKAKTEELGVYENYGDYSEFLSGIAGHRVLAINRGEKEKILTVKVDGEHEQTIRYLNKQWVKMEEASCVAQLEIAIEDSYKRLLFPSIEREIRSAFTEKAEEGAIKVFAKNLEQLLMQAPIAGHVVVALDPAFRTGVKTAVIDEYGKVLDTAVIYPTPPQSKVKEAKVTLKKLIDKHKATLIAIGNGTASRETESFVVELIGELPQKVQYVIVNEAGASVYSASKLGSEEFPDYDVALRSAVSIGRRLQDPLAELVKIEPKAIGVGQYQHDMNQKTLGETLFGVVEDAVNKVGVNVNTASAPLLSYISGISSKVAKNIVAYREEKGKYQNRKELLKVSGLGNKSFEQAAGFLRVPDSEEALDNTGVHPESYDATHKLLEHLQIGDIRKEFASFREKRKKIKDMTALAKELGVGEMTLVDIFKELEKPGRDPREDMPAPILRQDVLEISDLKEGMVLKGTVRNVIDFGAFVDIGVHQDGLVHISQMSKKFIKHPLEVVSVNDVVEVKVLSADAKTKRISLTMLMD
ncbi:MAG: Tex family protein [Eubacteriales bacterium]|nr:Tex family protein [Eubacteriales bacterium]